MKRSKLFITAAGISFAFGVTSIAYADTPFLRQEQLQEQKIQHAISASRSTAQLTKPIAVEQAVEVDPSIQDLSSTAFLVREIVVDDNLEEFSFLEDMTASYTNQEITLAEAAKLLAAMNQKLSDKGYVTSRVVIPEQNVASGLFHLKLLAGRMGRVVYAEGCKAVTWRNAFPIHEGDLLNVYLLEQGVEQMRKVASQDVSMQILPANAAGVSDVELTTYAGKQLSGSLSVDNAGLAETGKYQWTLTTGIDRFFHANDQLQFSFSLDGSRDGSEKGTRNLSFSYSIPRGKDTLTFRHDRYRYHQTVRSIPYDFISQGKTSVSRLMLDHLISRNRMEKRSWDLAVIKRDSHTFLNDMEIPVQRLDRTALEIGLSDQLRLGNSSLCLRLAHRQGMGWLGAQKENEYSDAPKSRYKLWIFDADWYKPLTLGHRPASFSASFHGQWNTAGKRLYGIDQISIGNSYTVRGFDGEYTLMGESGWYLRNELSSRIPSLHSDVYVGVDVGSVYGISTESLVGHTIAGLTIGLRGHLPSHISYDASISRVLYHPEGYHTRKWVPSFSMSWHF